MLIASLPLVAEKAEGILVAGTALHGHRPNPILPNYADGSTLGGAGLHYADGSTRVTEAPYNGFGRGLLQDSMAPKASSEAKCRQSGVHGASQGCDSKRVGRIQRIL